MRWALVSMFLILSACASDVPAPPPPRVDLAPLAPGVWVHTSWKDLPETGPFPSNGLVVATGGSMVLIDTAWTPEATETLLKRLEKEQGLVGGMAILTHAHDDRMGGLEVAHAKGFMTWAASATKRDARSRGLGEPQVSIRADHQVFTLPGATLDVFHPGSGHTRDNVVVYHRESGVLFGGCLVRAANASDLGNTADADIDAWASSIAKLQEAFPDARMVVPGHGDPGGPELLEHTRVLAESAADNS